MNYFKSADAMTSLGERKGIEAIQVLFDKFLPDLEKNPALLAKRAYWIGSFHMRDGDAAKGRSFLRRAWKAQPFNPRYLAAALASLFGQGAYRTLYGMAK